MGNNKQFILSSKSMLYAGVFLSLIALFVNSYSVGIQSGIPSGEAQSSLVASNPTPYIGQQVLLTAEISGGYPPYAYSMTILNSSGHTIGTSTVVSTSQYATLSFTPKNNALGIDKAYVSVTENTTPSVSYTLNTSFIVSGSLAGSGSSSSGSPSRGGTVLITTYGSSSCSTISNFSQNNYQILRVSNNVFKVTEDYITPTTAGITVNNTEYEFGVKQPLGIGAINGVSYNITMLNLSYTPAHNAVVVSICGRTAAPAQPATTTVAPSNGKSPSVNAPSASSASAGSAAAGAYPWLILLALLLISFYLYNSKRPARKNKTQKK